MSPAPPFVEATSTWVLVPGTPILLPDVAGASDPAAELRSVCVEELRNPLTAWTARPQGGTVGPGEVTVLAAGSVPRTWSGDAPYDVSRLLGGSRPAGPSIPLALAVGRHLVRAAGWSGPLALQTVAGPTEPGPAGLVVAVGDGSRYRSAEGGPGAQDPRSVAFDEQVRRVLADGDVAGLRALDVELATALGVTGRVPWRLLADAAGGGPVEPHLGFAGDPFGPYALVATWWWR
ncbi:MAG: hypothetical protein ACR2LI_07185 [Propionibacteriaceae bacterium]